MDIDLEDSILFSLQQQQQKYNANNSKAHSKKRIAEQEEELLCLSQLKKTPRWSAISTLFNKVQSLEPIAIQGDTDARSVGFNDIDSSINNNDAESTCDTGEVSSNNHDSIGVDRDINELIDELSSDNRYEDLSTESLLLLHQLSSISTKSYCIDLLKLLRDANISKSHSKRFISLIRSALPIPNNFPATFDNLLSFLGISDLFIKRSVCLLCKTDLHFSEKKCTRCLVNDEKLRADIYNVDLNKVLTIMLKRLSPCIEEYKYKIKNNIDQNGTKDIPFGRLYRRLLEKHSSENIISLILHLDGIGLTRSTHLKMWLFSGALVELPPVLRYRRHNMLLISVWVGYSEPDPDVWLGPIISELNYMKTQGM